MKILLWIFVFFVIAISVASVFARNNLTDSVTGTVGTVAGATWNSGGFFSYDGVNDYLDTGIGVNYTGSMALSGWFRNTNGSVCTDGASVFGRGYDKRIFTGGVCEAIANIQNSSNQDRTHYNASLLFANNTWVHWTWTYDASVNISTFYTNGVFRSNLTQRGVDQISPTLTWRMGGDPVTGLYLKGDITNVTVWSTSLNQANVSYLLSNGTPYCSGLANWWSFSSTVPSCRSATEPYDLFVNITIGTAEVRVLPEDYAGAHTANNLGFPSYSGSTLRNHSKQLAVWDSMVLLVARLDIDLGNICLSYSGSTANPCVWSTSNTSAFSNINIHRSLLGNLTARGTKVHFVNDGPSAWMADNSSKCNYGAGSPTFDYVSCDAFNNTIFANAISQYFEALSCHTTYYGLCVYEGRNEAYLITGGGSGAGYGVFYYRNTSVTCVERIAGTIKEWNETIGVIKSRLGDAVTYLSGAMNWGYSSCGQHMAKSHMGNFTAGSAKAPDYMNTHEYASGCPSDLDADLKLAEDGFIAGGYPSAWMITESGLNNNACNWANQSYQGADLFRFWLYGLTNTTVQRWLLFQWDGAESYTIFNDTNNTVRYPGLVLNATKFISDTEGTVYNCTTTNANVHCGFVQKNSTQGVLMIVNDQELTVKIQAVSRASTNLTSARSNTNQSAIQSNAGKVENITLGYYGFDGFNVTIQSGDMTAPTITNRTEWTNSSMLQVNFTCSENCNATLNYGTNHDVLGIKVNNANFLPYHSFNLTGLSADTLYHYNITIWDAAGNVRNNGIFSEQTRATFVPGSPNATFRPTTAKANDTIALLCGGNSSYPAAAYNYSVFLNGTLQATNVSRGYFLQEAVNEPNGYGAVTTGIISEYGIAASNGFLLENWTANATVGGAIWEVTHGLAPDLSMAGPANYTVPTACLAPTIQTRIYTRFTQGSGQSYGQCYTGSTWLNVTNISTCSGPTVTNTGVTGSDNWKDGVVGSNGTAFYLSGINEFRDIPATGATDDGTGSGCSAHAFNAQMAGVVRESRMYWAQGYVSNQSINVYNVTQQRKGTNVTLSCSIIDFAASSFVNATITIGNTAPNATLVSANAISGGVTCSFTYADLDNDSSASTFRWFRNSTLLSSTSQNLTSGNYSISDQVRCEVTPKDGTDSGTAVNSSAYNPSDVTAPTVSSISYPVLTTTTDITRVSAVCTDDYNVAVGYPVVSWTNPSGTPEVNRSMTLLSGNTYYLDFVYLTAGYYSDFKVHCRDGSGNTGNLTNAATMAVVTGSTSTGGGGGGGATTVVQSVAGVEIIKPAGKSIDRSCSANQTIDDFDVTLYNPTGSDTTYTFKQTAITCSAIPALAVPAKQSRTVTVKGCECGGQGETIRGSIEIIDARSPSETIASLPVTLSEDILALILTPKFIMAVLGLIVFLAVGIGLVKR
jgi:hypothetical protein